MKRLLILLLLVLLAPFAHAQLQPASQRWPMPDGSVTTSLSTAVTAKCKSLNSAWEAYVADATTRPTVSFMCYQPSPFLEKSYPTITVQYYCTAGTLSGNMCDVTTTTTVTSTTTTTGTCPAAGTSHFAGTETYSNAMNLNQCIGGCGYTASGGMKVGAKHIIFGPMIATGLTCTDGSSGYGSANDPGSRCSYRNAAGVCEAACKTGQEYKQVPTGAYACVTTSNTPPDTTPKDTTCPRGYINISQEPGNPNCAPTGGLGSTSNNGPANCPAGQHSTNNGPNGASYCVFDAPDTQKPATTTEKSPETTTNNPDGSTTKTRTETWNNSDGSTSTKTITETTGPDGKVTTSESTVTGKNKLGVDGTSDGGADAKSDFCKQNPGLTICKNSTVEGVGSATTCTGDMIQCELLKRFSTAFDTSPTAASTLGNSLLSGNDPLVSTLPKPSNGLSLSLPGSLNQTGFLGSSCLVDKQISLAGFSAVIPYSQACNGMLALRAIILVLASFACLRILSSVIFK